MAHAPNKPRNERGMALLLVITVLAILATLSLDMSFSSQVQLKSAAVVRDKIRARYLAQSALQWSKALLAIQQQVDQLTAALNITLDLWSLIPIDSGALQMVLSATDSSAAEPTAGKAGEPSAAAAFSPGEGSFHAEIEDEGAKINITRAGGLLTARNLTVNQLRTLFAPPKYDYLFDSQDENGQVADREEVVSALGDWVDNDKDMWGLYSGPEDNRYNNYRPVLLPKNASYDSLEELHMVRGVSDDFMDAFGDKFTVYLGQNGLPNIKTANAMVILSILMAGASTPNTSFLPDPGILEAVVKILEYRDTFGISSVQDFQKVAKGLGVELSLTNLTNLASTDRSQIYRIKAVGEIGSAQTTLNVVYNAAANRTLYYRED